MIGGVLRRLWPSSLVGQILLAVAAALLAAQAVNFGLLMRERERQIFQQTSEPSIERLIAAVSGTATGNRNRPHRSRRWITVSEASAVTPAMARRADIAERAEAAFAERGIAVRRVEAGIGPVQRLRRDRDGDGDRTETRRRSPPDMLVISAETASGRWVSSYSLVPQQSQRLIGALLFQTVILYVIVLAVVWFAVRRIARPLKELTQATERFGAGAAADAPVPVESRGPADIRQLIDAFEGMRIRIGAMLAEKDHMLGAIGHDLRTPLASLRVRAECVDDEDERNRMAQTIDEMNRTLDDILSLARLGRPSEPPTLVDLTALVEAAVEDFRDLDHAVAFEPGARLTAAVRSNLIKRAVRNLIENALKYGESVSVDLSRRDDGIAIEVADRGPGIPDDRIEQMFEPFARLEESRSRDTGGTGLGLALARAIATGHGGSLTLANRPGGGLVARLWVPAAPA